MPEDDTSGDSQPSDDTGNVGRQRPRQTPDVEALAEKVYQLMLAEARLARARGEAPSGVAEE